VLVGQMKTALLDIRGTFWVIILYFLVIVDEYHSRDVPSR
jgi:hypothetical protein